MMLYPIPTVRRSEDGTMVRATLHTTSASVNFDGPFGPDISLSAPLPLPATIDSLIGATMLHHTLELEDAQTIWAVLTVALMALEPGYVAACLRQLEGDEVLRQETEYRKYTEEEPC